MTQQINLTIISGADGGLIVYENLDGESALMFGGDLDATSKYLTTRMQRISTSAEQSVKLSPAARETIGRRLLEICDTDSAA